jgi:hypothetical protein
MLPWLQVGLLAYIHLLFFIFFHVKSYVFNFMLSLQHVIVYYYQMVFMLGLTLMA